MASVAASLVLCTVMLANVLAQNDDYYGPQTFRQTLFKPAKQQFVERRATQGEGDYNQDYSGAEQSQSGQWQGASQGQWQQAQAQPTPSWAQDNNPNRKIAIIHHKQALTHDGNFRYEYAAENGLAVGETIAPDGSRIGAYQYKDPSGQVVTLKYRAGKEGFQILEGNHLPKAPEPLPVQQPQAPRPLWSSWPNQQQQQQSYNAGGDNRRQWNENQANTQQALGPKQGWGSASQDNDGRQVQAQPQQPWIQPQQGLDRPEAGEDGDNGEYREDKYGPQGLTGSWDGSRAQQEEQVRNQGPHSFGDGYSFAFQG